MADLIEVVATTAEGAGEDHAAFCEQQKLIEKRDNVGTRLMNRKDDGSLVRLCQGDKRLNHIESIVGVQARSGFITEEDAWACDQFASDRNSTLFTTTDASTFLASPAVKPDPPIRLSLMPRMPSSCMVSRVRNFLASSDMSSADGAEPSTRPSRKQSKFP